MVASPLKVLLVAQEVVVIMVALVRWVELSRPSRQSITLKVPLVQKACNTNSTDRGAKLPYSLSREVSDRKRLVLGRGGYEQLRVLLVASVDSIPPVLKGAAGAPRDAIQRWGWCD